MIQDFLNDQLATLRGRYRSSGLKTFIDWWFGELSALLPAHFRERLVPPRPTVLLVPDASGQELSVWRGGEAVKQLDRFGMAEDLQLLKGRWQEALTEFDEGQPEIRLCLPGEEVLQAPVELPAAVEANLAQALGYQLDQLTPFRADQVWSDFRVDDKVTERGRLQVELRVVPKVQLDELLKWLGSIGITLHAIDTLPPQGAEKPRPEGFNLIPEAQRPRHVYARARLNWVLAGIAVVVLALVMVQSLHLRGQTVTGLQAEVDRLRAEAMEVMALRQQLDDALEAANFLAEHRSRQPVIVPVLDEVTRLLPNDIWLQQFRIENGQLMLQGQARGAQQLIDLINGSDLLGDAEFRGAISLDPQTNRERFNASARVLTAGGGDDATTP